MKLKSVIFSVGLLIISSCGQPSRDQKKEPEKIIKTFKKRPVEKVNYIEAVYDSLNGKYIGVAFFSKQAKIDYWSKEQIELKNPFGKFKNRGLEDLSLEDQKFVLNGTVFSEGFDSSAVKLLFPITFSGLEPHSIHKWLVLSHNLFFKVDEIGIIAKKAVIEVYDNTGKLYSQINSNNCAGTQPLVTKNGKYLLQQYGGDDGESGYFKSGIRIYELPEGNLIYTLETDDLAQGNDAYSKENVFIKSINRHPESEYLIFDPEKMIAYRKTLGMEELKNIKRFEETGYLLRNGSFLLYEEHFDITKMSHKN